MKLFLDRDKTLDLICMVKCDQHYGKCWIRNSKCQLMKKMEELPAVGILERPIKEDKREGGVSD